MRPILALLALLPLIACGPVSREQAERDCLHTARLAQQPRGSVGIGVDSNGDVSPQFDVTVSSDYLSGRDPSQVYEFLRDAEIRPDALAPLLQHSRQPMMLRARKV